MALTWIADRIASDPEIMGGKPLVRGMRFSVRDLLELLASGATRAEVLEDFPYLEDADISAALAYAASLPDLGASVAAE
jgi:uncharacterized protein (DUF433 family)